MCFIEIAKVKNFLITLFTGLIFCGCSITPRYHSFGFNLEWKSRNTPRAKSTTSPILAESQLQFAPLHNEIRETKQELHPTAEISHQPVNKYLSVNCEHRAIHFNTQQKPNLQTARTQGSTVSAKTTDTTPSKVGKPIKSAVEKIATPQGIEVLNRKIKIANWLILFSHGPLFYIFWEFSQIKIIGFLEFFIFLSLIGFASIPILIALIHRFELGRKRRTLYYSVNIQNKEAARLLAKYYSRAVIYLFFAGNVLLGIFLLTDKFKMKELFNKINTLEPNNEYVLEQQEKIEFLYDISMVLFYLSLGGIILRLIV